MKRHVILTALGLALAHTAASAQFFFMIPGPLIDAAADKLQGVEGQHCVSPSANVGDVIRLDNGQYWKVMSLSGTSSRCKGVYPIRARLEYQLPENMRTAEHTECVPLGARVGDKLQIAGLGEVQVKRIANLNHKCGTTGIGSANVGSKEATVMSTQAAPREVVAPVAPAPVAPIPVVAAPEQSTDNPHAKRLRELSGLLKDGLITQQDYDAKKSEILKAL